MKQTLQLFIFIALCLGGAQSAQSQNQPPLNCGADKVLQGDSATRKLLAQFNQSYLTHSLNKAALDLTTVYTIPVVVHVYHLGEAVGVGSNVSTASVQAAIDGINQTFRAQGAFSASQDVKIQFVLASRTPDCQVTNGIVRVDARSISGYQANGCSSGDYTTQSNLRTLSTWPTGSYVNIRIVHKMPDAAGFTWFLDDLFLPAQYTNGDYPRLWGHEMGHSFNLYHTFQGDNANTQCPVNTNPATDGDRISDTDPHKQGDNCATHSASAINACTGLPFGALMQNMMSYSGCLNRFTPKQVERMRYALQYYRPGLINSFGKVPPVVGELSPTVACVVSAPGGISSYFGIESFTFNTISVGGGGPTSESGANYSDRTCLVQTNVQTGVPYSFSLTSLNGNELGAKIFIDYNNNGSFLDANEQVFSSGGYSSSFSGTITIPVGTTANTKLRMRVMLDPTLDLTACSLPGFSPYGSGMAEDYAITVVSATTCTPAVATLTGSQTSTSGQPVSLTTTLTGTSPWSLTLNTGQVFTTISTSPFTFTVAPTTATTYTINRVDNSCGTGTVNGSATITPYSPAVILLSDSPTDTPGQTTDPLTPTISGTATPGSQIIITGPGPITLCTTTASASGTFACTLSATLPVGPNTLTVTASGPGGSSSVPVTFTTVARPTLAILSPSDNGTATTTPTVSGTATPLASVTVLGPNSQSCVMTASALGTFSCTSLTFTAGPQSVTVVVSNRGGTATDENTFTVVQPTSNSAPSITPDFVNAVPGLPATGNVLTNDTDPQGLPLTVSLLTPPSTGTVVISPTGNYTYTPPAGFTGTVSFCYSASNTTGQSSSACVSISVQLPPRTGVVSVPVRVFLQGALTRPGTIVGPLMRDDLRRKGLIPTTEPYTAMGYVHINGGSSLSIASPSAVFSVTGANAIIDWVMVELRSTTYPYAILATTPGLLQADGDVVQTDGVTTVAFSQSALGTTAYQVSVHHRNHLGVMTANPISLTGTVAVVDFTSSMTLVYQWLSGDPRTQTVPLALERGLLALWAGNTNGDQSVILQGPNNDVDPVFFDVVDYLPNTAGLTNYIRSDVYLNSDVDMNGQVIFQGEGNEVDILFFEIMLHPGNEIGQFINYIIWK